MFRVYGTVDRPFFLVILLFFLLVTGEASASACVVDSAQKIKEIEVSGELVELPFISKDCCSISSLSASVVLCFTSGNKCYEVDSQSELKKLQACEERPRLGKLSWLLSALKATPGETLALQRSDEPKRLTGYPYNDVLATNRFTLFKPLSLEGASRFVLFSEEGVELDSLPFDSQVIKINTSNLENNRSYQWKIYNDGLALYSGDFFLASEQGLNEELLNLINTYRRGELSQAQILSLSLELYDHGFKFNAYQILNYKNKR
ncbi:hypothetical protein [Paraferrimonas sedimenticola]|uniref:Uncharacterized protein n=1 Tax=Paraferrimonas sedimenticola TaxID=375674 RepID=A0AA37RZ90_9GAMM|nr:hypothetical protein [Paraferrimonas sedimenticola]GLP97607.1 hypothetical protein GCM10007895_29140 [Paraferrimonas sedimenticola]